MNNKYKLQNQSLNLLKFIANLVLCMCVFFYSSFVCISEYANVYFKTTITKPNIKMVLTAGVPSSQALPGFLITAPPSVCVSAVLGTLAVWIQKKKNVPLGAGPKVRKSASIASLPWIRKAFEPTRLCYLVDVSRFNSDFGNCGVSWGKVIEYDVSKDLHKFEFSVDGEIHYVSFEDLLIMLPKS